MEWLEVRCAESLQPTSNMHRKYGTYAMGGAGGRGYLQHALVVGGDSRQVSRKDPYERLANILSELVLSNALRDTHESNFLSLQPAVPATSIGETDC